MTQLFGLIGHPVGHSLSPAMHNDAFQRLGIDAHYQAFDIDPAQFGTAIQGLKALGIKGFNVTIPYKVDIMEHLDEIDPLAQAIGAVNTVCNVEGRYVGYNTDGEGYVKSLLQVVNEKELSAKNVLIIGAGGAAKAIFYTLASQIEQPNVIYLANRTVQKAEALIGACPIEVKAEAVSLLHAKELLQEVDIVINTTSVGMHPNIDEEPLDLQRVQEGAVVSDIIYNPLETKWLKNAGQAGAVAHNGVGMFIMQGALAFEKWTGRAPDTKAMEEIVLKHLNHKK